MASKAQLLGIINTQLASNQPILASQHRAQIITMLDELYNAQSRGNVLSGLPLTSLQLANDTFLAFRNGAALQIPFSSIFDDPLTLGTANGLELDETVLSLVLASANTTGALSDADFNIFSAKQDEADKGQPNGYAQLDSGAKIPISLIPDIVLGQVEYQGTWNATTNTPTLPNTPDKKGEYYVVSTAGTFVGIDFQVGDWIISNGVEWEKVNNTDAVRTVFGRLGDVVANANDYASFYVTIDTAQTITGAKVFSLDSSFNGVSVGRGGGSLQNNTRVGLSALENNTTGSENTAIGLQALLLNTTGNFNTANGFQALRQNTTGGDNTANGFSALENNSTGSFNTAFGFSTLENNTTGSSNTAFGHEAGRGLANNTALTIAHNSIFIGRNTKAALNDQSNQIVIGNNAIGQGSDTVTIGNSSTILNKFFGTVIHADAVNADESATLGQVTGLLHNPVTLGTANGLSLTNQVLSLGLSSANSTGALSSTDFSIFNAKIAGSGTTNFLSKFTGSGTIGNSAVFENGGNVGIGTDQPLDKLHISSGTSNTFILLGGISAFSQGLNITSADFGISKPAFAATTVVKGSARITFNTGTNGADEIMRVQSNGNVGIGKTNPILARLEVVGAIPSFFTADSQANSPTYGGSIFYRNHTGANQGNGITFDFNNASNARAEYAYIGGLIETNTAGSENGAIIFVPTLAGAREEAMRITSAGVVRIANLAGAGSRTVTADASGNLSASSDSSLKQEDTTHKIEGLAEILQLQPKAYKWLSDIEIRGEEAATEIGFFADEVNAIIPSAAFKGNDGLYGFYDRAVIAALVKAIQEQQEQIDSLKNQIN